MGRVLTLAQQKGGSGKTTLAVSLAAAAARSGLRVALLDTDPQGSLGRWFMTRRDALSDPGFVFSTASAWGVAYECDKLRAAADLVVVDTPPKVDADLRPALRAADLVLVPMSVSRLDLWAVSGVLDLVAREERTATLVLNRAAPRARLNAELTAELAGMTTARAETIVRNRVAFAESLGRGLSVIETAPSGPASAEVMSLWAELTPAIGVAQ